MKGASEEPPSIRRSHRELAATASQADQAQEREAEGEAARVPLARAAAAALREQYGVSSTCIFGQCFGGGRALEATARSYPNDTMDDVDGSIGPTHVNPSTCIAWYPTRYDASSLFGSDRKRTDDRNTSDVSIMAVFAENDTIPGATSNDAAKLKSCLEEDNRSKDHMVKVSLQLINCLRWKTYFSETFFFTNFYF